MVTGCDKEKGVSETKYAWTNNQMSPELPSVINYPFESKVTFPSIIKFHFFHSHLCRFLNIHHSFLSCISPEIMKFQIIFLHSPFSSSSNHCFRLRLFVFL